MYLCGCITVIIPMHKWETGQPMDVLDRSAFQRKRKPQNKTKTAMFILKYISELKNATSSFFQQLAHLCVTKVHKPQVRINIPQMPQLWSSVLAALSNSVVKSFLCPDRRYKLNTPLLNLLSVHTLQNGLQAKCGYSPSFNQDHCHFSASKMMKLLEVIPQAPALSLLCRLWRRMDGMEGGLIVLKQHTSKTSYRSWRVSMRGFYWKGFF